MRYLIVLTLFAAACTDIPLTGPHYDSVRERLSNRPTALYIHDETSSGSVTARRRGHDDWITGTAALAIEHGHLRAALDDNGQLAIDQLEIAVAPIALDGVFSKPAQLQDVKLRLVEPVRSDAAWTSDDNAAASLVMQLDFDWSIAFDGGEAYPLASQHLPPQSVDVTLAGSGDHIEALVDLEAAGELWNWADIVQITELSLSLSGSTAD
jgi:hypothetical protein